MAEPRRFKASTQESREKPNHPFFLDGVYARGHVPEGSDGTWELQLEALAEAPLAAIEALGASMLYDENTGRNVVNPAAITQFFYACLVPESTLAFRKLVDDKTRLVELAALSDVMEWLAEIYTGRPTGAPSSSGNGSEASGAGVSGGSPWPGGTSPAPTT